MNDLVYPPVFILPTLTESIGEADAAACRLREVLGDTAAVVALLTALEKSRRCAKRLDESYAALATANSEEP